MEVEYEEVKNIVSDIEESYKHVRKLLKDVAKSKQSYRSLESYLKEITHVRVHKLNKVRRYFA